MLSYDESVGYPTTRTSRNIIRFLHAHLKRFDITPEQWTILKRVSESDGLTPKELSRITDKDKATVTRILEVLDRKALITKQSNDKDKRSMMIHITETGRQHIREITPFVQQLFAERLLQGISERELEIYKQVLSRINDNVANDLGPNF